MVSNPSGHMPQHGEAQASSRQDADHVRPSEVPLPALLQRSASLAVANTDLSQGLDSARRLDALEWLVQAFDALNLPDTHLFAAFGLLDRFAAASPGPISAGPGAFALVLAAMLIALKVSGTHKDLDRAKRLVVEVSHGSARPWPAVRRAELSILRRLQFRACTPTSRDILDKLLAEMPDPTEEWSSESQSRCISVARFVLELGIVHEPEEFYGRGRPPLAAAVAALHLACDVLNAPPHLVEALREPLAALEQAMSASPESAGDAVSGALEAMRRRWELEERRLANSTHEGAQGAAVLEKWLRRVGTLPAAPKIPLHELRLALIKSSRATPTGGRLAAVGGSHLQQQSNCSALPSTSRRLPQAAHAQQAFPGMPLATCQAAPEHHEHDGQSTSAPLHLQVPTPAKKANRPMMSARLPDQPLSHVPAAENLPSWNAVSSMKGEGLGFELKVPSPRTARPTMLSARGPAPVAADASHQEQPVETLVELTHVLNMVAPRPQQQAHLSSQNSLHGGAGKQKSPTVAAELLLSSAMRMQWPPDKRRIGRKEAASTCRDAAAVLKEAADQLLNAAAQLESGAVQVKAADATSESKRRRTFTAGMSPQGAHSPAGDVLAAAAVEQMKAGSAWASAIRGSPPLRYGLRV